MPRNVERFTTTLRRAFAEKLVKGGRLPSGSLAVVYGSARASVDLETGDWHSEAGSGSGWFGLARLLGIGLDDAARLWGDGTIGRVPPSAVPPRVRIPLPGGSLATGQARAGEGVLVNEGEGPDAALPRGDR